MLEFANALVLMLLGAMLFFPSVVAPVVFTSLPEAQAGAFLRSMFPRYYAFMIALSLIAALLFLVCRFPSRAALRHTCTPVMCTMSSRATKKLKTVL